MNTIDLDITSGQIIQTGTTTTGTGQVKIVNTDDNQIVAALDQFLDFGGAPTLTGSAATLTIDVYGRVVGFSAPDEFNMTIDNFTSTSGQTVFTPTARAAGYIVGQDLIFKNGVLLPPSEYTESSTTFTLNTGAALNDHLICITFRAKSGVTGYVNTSLSVLNVAGAVVTWDSAQMPNQLINAGDQFTFANTGTPTVYTVSSVDYVTHEITFTGSVTASAGAIIYNKRTANASYPVFSRFEATLTNTSSYTPTEWAFHNGYELIFFNGTVVVDQDYDISGSALTNFPSLNTCELTNIQFNLNNLGTPVGTPVNTVTFTVNGQTIYSFNSVADALNIYANGLLLTGNIDYNSTISNYTLANTPDNNITVLLQQTFNRIGAA